MNMSAQLHAPAALSAGQNRYVDTTVSLDVSEKRTVPCLAGILLNAAQVLDKLTVPQLVKQ